MLNILKKKVAIVFSSTSNLAFAIANSIIAIEKYSPNFVDAFYFFHDNNISVNDKKAFDKLSKVNLIHLKNHIQNFNVTGSAEYFTTMCYGIFEIFELLHEYKNVIFLDPDIIIIGDIKSIISNKPITIRNSGKSIFNSFTKIPKEIKEDFNTRNTGVVVVNDQFPYKGFKDFCYEKTIEHWGNCTFADQAMLALCLFLKKIKIDDLPYKYNAINEINNTNVIIHCINKDKKPWNNNVVKQLYPQWEEHNSIWKAMGGDTFKGNVSFSDLKNFDIKNTPTLMGFANIFLRYYKNFLDRLSNKVIEENKNLFINSVYKNNRYYFTIDNNSIFRYEVGVFKKGISGLFLTIKLYTNSEEAIKKLENDTLLKNNLPGFQIKKHLKDDISFQKEYSLSTFDYSEKTLSKIISETCSLIEKTKKIII